MSRLRSDVYPADKGQTASGPDKYPPIVARGGFAFAPRGTLHNFRNTAETPSRILLGFTPGGMEGFFRDSGQPATGDGPAPPVDEAEIARMMAAAPKYGVEHVNEA